ncbi:aminoglycoside phosphotransferase family protein [Nesterenkonia sp. NBAIMH1]|uniref:aminoglycoside phosphotransferase family protein n=1 Tax=Nesterenkonia sp. NBAIMH1 TaxID=2600320 RepID=UPI0011B565A8|nr:aminoglycoside phosphotransferase family protein [Nesterenkonia sp. NBAIMH1]
MPDTAPLGGHREPALPDTPGEEGSETERVRSSGESAQLEYLSSADAHPPIISALQQSGIYATSVHLESLQHRPGAGVTGIYRIVVSDPARLLHTEEGRDEPRIYAAEGDHIYEVYVGVSTERIRAESKDVVSAHSPAGPLAIWQHPCDPALSGLRVATDPVAVARRWGQGSRLTSLETVSYRPLRRAVIAADFADGSRTYLKVLRRGRAEDLARRHHMLLSAGVPAPRPLREPVEDVVALRQGEGISLAEHFLEDGAARVRPQDFVQLLEALPAEVMDLPAREAWTDRLPSYASAAQAALPEAAPRIAALRDLILTELTVTDRGPVVPAHGDFYEANMLMQGGTVSCLLDVDALGPGHRVDDLACFLGHLAVLPAVDPRYVHVPAAFDRFARVFAQNVDEGSLRVRSASVALSLVAGARDTRRSGWKEQAEHRLRCAEAIVGLTSPSGSLAQWPGV